MAAPATIEAAFRGRLGQFELDATFVAPAAGITALFGPSGSGKTSLLRCIAGLQRLDGRCVVGTSVWQDAGTFLPVHQRPLGYVFQEASLFAHLSVRGNLLYGAPRGARRALPADFAGIVDLLGIAPLLDRAPQNLSGGERQRVAIGRALLSRPELLLMDEPLAALDRDRRAEILPYLERLHASLSLPILYVSHDLAEVEQLADHIVLMQDGRVLASGPLPEIQADPALPLARSREAAVALQAVVAGLDPAWGLAALDVAGARLLVPVGDAQIGQARRLRIAARDVSLARSAAVDSSILNIVPARLVGSAPLGEHEMLAVLALGPAGTGARLLSRLTRRSWQALGLAEGAAVFAQIRGVALAAHGSATDPA
jgi:molybdate transport system ATP-binding protein